MKFPEDFVNKVICGDTLASLKQMPDECVDMVITSPPYYGLRNYQVDGQIGLEPTFEEYLDKIMEIMKELKRIIKKTGSIWVNFGDCYGGHPAGNKFISEANIGTDGVFVRKMRQNEGAKSFVGFDKKNYGGLGQKRQDTTRLRRGRRGNQASKCLLLQPERFAIRCIDELGLILRNKIVWAKQILVKKENETIGSVMPTSVKDRFNESYEFLYFFVKNKKYYSDLDAVRLPPNAEQKVGQLQFRATEEEIKKYKRNWRQEEAEGYKMGSVDPYRAALRGELKFYQGKFAGNLEAEMFGSPRVRTQRKSDIKGMAYYADGEGVFHKHSQYHPLGKTPPSVWQINPEPHNFQKELNVNVDHFAVFPEALCEIPIKFACPPNGIVLDPFAGSGTALLVAKKLGRNFIGIDLNPSYCEIAKKRLEQTPKSLV